MHVAEFLDQDFVLQESLSGSFQILAEQFSIGLCVLLGFRMIGHGLIEESQVTPVVSLILAFRVDALIQETLTHPTYK